MKRRPLRAVGGFGLSAMCICLSTIFLQVLTTPSPASFSSFLARLNSVNSFPDYRVPTNSEPSLISSVDFLLHNLSVQRVRYVDENISVKEGNRLPPTNSIAGVHKILTDLMTSTFTRRELTHVSSVVVTWEDHPLAIDARAKNARLEEEEIKVEDVESDIPAIDSMTYSYEVEIWVTGWGLDGFWNAANRKVTLSDPFVVLSDLPLDREMCFRVRMKAKETTKSVLGWILPMGFLATETDGEWSDVVTLSPTRDDEFEAIVTSLADNKLLVLLLAMCIGSGCLVVIQLYVRPVLAVTHNRKLLKMQQSRRLSSATENASKKAATTDDTNEDSNKSMKELEHEIHDLRQELADTEDEVRQLMLLSGCGIETLSLHELEQLERKLKYTLKRIQCLKKARLDTTRDEQQKLSVNEPSRRERRGLKQRDNPYVSTGDY